VDSPEPAQRWYGKVIGVVVGIALLRANPLLGALLGLLIGHAIDAGWFAGRPQRPSPPRDDPYRVLGLTEDASDAEVDRAWRRLISQHHPDRAAPGARHRQAEHDAGAINAAYDRIRTLRQRKD